MRKIQLGIKHGFAKFGSRFVALVFQQVDLLGIIAQRYQITEKRSGRNRHILGAVRNLTNQLLQLLMVYFRNIRLLNVKLVRDLVKKVNDPVEVFNKLENIAAQVRYQILFVQLALNFSAQRIRIVLNNFYLFAGPAISFAAALLKINIDCLFKNHCHFNYLVMQAVYIML